MTNPHAEIHLPLPSKWIFAEAVRVRAQLGTNAVDDGLVHRATVEAEYGVSSPFRIIKCQKALVSRESGWVAVDEPVDCLSCLADGG